ncbi:MAG: DNA polymerase III subunit gamma/tau [Candidatus Saccharimonadales bacterium]
MAIALYRKYRSKTFDELIGQDHITKNLKNALQSGRISHAYLFSGPKGVGKTSAARILAREVNKLKPGEDTTSLDIIEIDAASNRRIDEIRELREKVHIAPTKSEFKVYIIDEVHMLTNEAFNALLKTLEEPPRHAIFVLATTEPHKLPETIISRTQHFTFRPVASQKVVEHLESLAKKEKIIIEKDALILLARAGAGSIRDSISLLDQAANLSEGKIDTNYVAEMLGFAELPLLEELSEAIAKQDAKLALSVLKKFWEQGTGASFLLSQLLEVWREALYLTLSNQEPPKYLENSNATQIATVIKKLSNINPNNPYMEALLETTIVQLCLIAPTNGVAAKNKVEEKTILKKETEKLKKPKKEPAQISKAKAFTNTVELTDNQWLKALSQIKSKNNSLYALLRSASYELEEGKVVVLFRFVFHKRRLEEASNRQLLEKVLEKVTGTKLRVSAEVKQTTAPSQKNVAEKDSEAAAVLDILGGEIVKPSKFES